MQPRILIADDSAVLRAALRGLFGGIGDYEIIEAETGTETLSKAKESGPDLIILDFAMPAMDGLSVTRLLRKRLPEIPILMYTMHYTQQLCVDARSAGVRKLISKSETNDLVTAVQELLAPATATAKPPPASITNATREDEALQMPGARTGSQEIRVEASTVADA